MIQRVMSRWLEAGSVERRAQHLVGVLGGQPRAPAGVRMLRSMPSAMLEAQRVALARIDAASANGFPFDAAAIAESRSGTTPPRPRRRRTGRR